jgi:hypothetical protein
MDPANRNRRRQPAENRKLARPHFPVKNLVREGVGNKRQEASLWSDSL